ncbi:tail assembly protein [Desulfoluna limicola]|uniref:Tail assembly protein n=1 Tax=Desulfoluna limicola TaxID=2810562 RepID=A0ABM7PAS5_9BACT|nr:phage tail protein [Desulfoluna limicola]BCS94627.1 tail assembly protein [Desulfoluna limicola]
MTDHVMMALGNYRFSVSTAAYQEFKRSTSYRWAEQARAGRRPALQYMGPGKETLELSGTIYPVYKGGIGQVDDMRTEAGKGKPLSLVDGRGMAWGKWCIESIEEDQAFFLPGGIPKKQTFRLSLVAYGEDV